HLGVAVVAVEGSVVLGLAGALAIIVQVLAKPTIAVAIAVAQARMACRKAGLRHASGHACGGFAWAPASPGILQLLAVGEAVSVRIGAGNGLAPRECGRSKGQTEGIQARSGAPAVQAPLSTVGVVVAGDARANGADGVGLGGCVR